MKIHFGSAGHLDLKLVNSPIANKWYNLIFQNETLELTVDSSSPLLANLYQQKTQAYKTLVQTVEHFNKILLDKNINTIPQHFKKFDSPTMTQQWYNSVHEQWAISTLLLNKLCYTQSQQRGKISGLIKKLVDDNYNQIKEQVHAAEFFNDYILFEMQYVDNTDEQFIVLDKAIVPDDTDWHTGFISLSYQDVGRPQFEEWLLKGKVTSESSNYTLFHRQLNMRITTGCMQTVPSCSQQLKYERFCQQHGLSLWKPYVNLIELADTVSPHMSEFIGDVFLPWLQECIDQSHVRLYITR